MKKVNAIPAVVMLTAGIITCFISIRKHYPALDTLVKLLAVLILFYLLGSIAKGIISRIIKKVQEEEQERLREEELLKQQEEEKELEEKEEIEAAVREEEEEQ